MSERDKIKIAVITILFPKEKDMGWLKEIILKKDNTFNELGAGGYEIRDQEDGFVMFTECDVAPATSCRAKIVGNNTIECNTGIGHFFYNILTKYELPFSQRVKEVPIKNRSK